MTAGVLEVEKTIEHLEPGDDVTCDVTTCEQAAAWWITCRVCSRRSAACDPCRVHAEVLYLLLGGTECRVCGNRGPTLRAVAAVTPIGGGC